MGLMIVVLDVIPRNLKIAHLGSLDPNSPESVVANVAVTDVHLVKVHFIEEDSGAAIVIQMAVTNQQVTVAIR